MTTNQNQSRDYHATTYTNDAGQTTWTITKDRWNPPTPHRHNPQNHLTGTFLEAITEVNKQREAQAKEEQAPF